MVSPEHPWFGPDGAWGKGRIWLWPESKISPWHCWSFSRRAVRGTGGYGSTSLAPPTRYQEPPQCDNHRFPRRSPVSLPEGSALGWAPCPPCVSPSTTPLQPGLLLGDTTVALWALPRHPSRCLPDSPRTMPQMSSQSRQVLALPGENDGLPWIYLPHLNLVG